MKLIGALLLLACIVAAATGRPVPQPCLLCATPPQQQPAATSESSPEGARPTTPSSLVKQSDREPRLLMEEDPELPKEWATELPLQQAQALCKNSRYANE